MKKLTTLLGYLFFIWTSALAQSSEIIYVLPDSVEVRLNQHLTRITKVQSEDDVFFLLKRDTLGLLNLTVIPYQKNDSSDVIRWVNSSKRYALVGEKRYRLLFDYDFLLSTPTPGDVGEYDHREGNVRRLHFIPHRYAIYFKMDGSIYKEEPW